MAQDQISGDFHADPEFHGLPLAEKHKVLMALDSDYRGLPPSEQAKALDEIHYGPASQSSDPGMTGSGRERLANAIDKGRGVVERTVSSAMEASGLPAHRDPDAISKFIGVKTGPSGKPALVDAIDAHLEAGQKSPVGYVPLLGPVSVRASEHAQAHEYPEMVGDIAAGVGTVAPFKGAGMKLADAAGAVVRDSSGAMRPSLKAASEVGGAVGGAAAMEKHPYIGAGVGYKAAPRLLDAVLPERAPAVRSRLFPIEDWTPASEGITPPAQVKTDPFSGMTSTSAAESKGQATLGPFLKKRMTAAEVKAQGIQTGKVREEAPQASQAPAKERLSAAMQRKVGEAEGRHDARSMARTGALRDEDSRTGYSASQSADEDRPVSRKGPDSKTSKAARGGKTRLKDNMSSFEAGGRQRANEISPMNPQEKAEIEQRVGKKLTDEEAYQERKKQGEWDTNTRLKHGTVDTDMKASAGLRDAQKKPGYGRGTMGNPKEYEGSRQHNNDVNRLIKNLGKDTAQNLDDVHLFIRDALADGMELDELFDGANLKAAKRIQDNILNIESRGEASRRRGKTSQDLAGETPPKRPKLDRMRKRLKDEID
jgi:hypothetical protein